ncbi:hypothetical protein D3C73_1122860 [compost metagenome]
MHDAMVRICRHKARQDVRLTEVTQPPAHQGNNGDKVQAFEHVHVLNALLFDHFQRVFKAADANNHHHRRQDQSKNHQAGLHGIGPADGQETTNKGIDNRRCRTRPQRCFITHAEGAFEQTRPCNNP